jgi:ATP-dependent Lon protease
VETVSLAGAMDSSAMGTSSQWHSARESVPLQLIKRTRVANPAIIWDEAEKASQDRRNGSALDALLPMLERSQAKAIRDPALELEVDLSMVSHFATANSLDGVPRPLRDRMRILQMPEPTWRHLGDLVEGIVTDLMLERGLDGRWVSPLAEDELDLVRQNWPGGSIRQLQRIVTTLVDGREMTWGNA